MNVVLKVWRQESAGADGRFIDYLLSDVDPGSMLLDALDVLNEKLVAGGERPIAFDSDCREGICGACGVVVSGPAHGGTPLATTCELSIRAALASDARPETGAGVITLEPFRTGAFPVVCDLVVDRGALDHVIMAGGFVTVRSGSAPEANVIPVPKADAELALDAAACIGCGACVAACPNGSAALFAGAKLSHLGQLPAGQTRAWPARARPGPRARRRRLRGVQPPRRMRERVPQRHSHRGHRADESPRPARADRGPVTVCEPSVSEQPRRSRARVSPPGLGPRPVERVLLALRPLPDSGDTLRDEYSPRLRPAGLEGK